MTEPDVARPELWGGLECSAVRLGDEYRFQFEETGHVQSPGDLDLVAALGIRTLRYPVLWETTAPESPTNCHWAFSDARLGRLRGLGIAPIVGLLHHGSGPRHTHMLDPQFAQKLAAFAGQVARRYPWVESYTPVNEPLTTARFSGLYGHWYPHGRDMACFLHCLVNECLATLLAMREIRKVNPGARLVQTEDLGKVFSTPHLREQAEHENQRRWLSLDLLCGRVDRSHPWHGTLCQHGIGLDALDLLASGEGTPDIIGINYYATSERYLDEQLHRYPACFHGGNGRQHYADAEALRVDLPERETGIAARLGEAWERYRLPLAVTEVHHGSTREEQLRWLAEVWTEACGMRRSGVDLRAVTAWSLMGAMDWNSLLTERRGHYEAGAFDVRGPQPRLTALGKALKQIADTGTITHPALDQKGWWRRDGRHYQPPSARAPALLKRPRSILIAGASGRLGQELTQACALRGLDITCPPRSELDVGDPRQVSDAMARYRPWAVINAAALPGFEANADPHALFRTNSIGAENLAAACAARQLPFMTFSPHQVFDGMLERPYVESDTICPACPAGRSKADAERRVRRVHPQSIIIRMSRLFGPGDAPVAMLRNGAGRLGANMFFAGTYGPDLVRVALDLLIDGQSGTWHLPNQGAVSVREMARFFPVSETATMTPQPLVVLASERAQLMPSLREALERQRDAHASLRQAMAPCPVAAE